jgi:hypothetical protein
MQIQLLYLSCKLFGPKIYRIRPLRYVDFKCLILKINVFFSTFYVILSFWKNVVAPTNFGAATLLFKLSLNSCTRGSLLCCIF